MARTPTSRLGQSVWSSGTDPVRRVDFNADATALENLVAIYDQGLLSARPVAGVEGRFYTVTGESDAKLNGRIYYDNGSVWTTTRNLLDGYSEASAAGATALIVKAAASPTVDILRVNNSADTALLKVTSNGIVSNQASVGVSGGFYLGGASTHDATAAFISIAVDKPTLIVKAITSQTSSLISARDVSNASVFSVSTAGNGVFSGSLSANSISSVTSVGAASVNSSASALLTNVTASPLNNSSASLIVKSFSNHQNNLIDFQDSTNARVARVTPEGTFATNSRVVIGNNNGNSTTPSYSSTTAALWVSNSYPTAPVARFIGNTTQSGKLLELVGSDAVQKFTVDNQGNTVATGNLSVANVSVNGSAATQYFGSSYRPLLEVLTGGEAGTYSQAITVRHAVQDATAVSRTLGLHFKFSTEVDSLESGKWAGIVAGTSEANAASPYLSFYSAGTESGRFDALNNLSIGGDLLLTNKAIKTQGGLRPHWLLSVDESQTVGLQTNTLYMRSPSFAWYNGGTHNDAQFNPGTGGSLLMQLSSGTDTRLSVPRLTLTSPTPFDSLTPVLTIGAVDHPTTHMQMSNSSINVYNNDQSSSSLTLQQSGGTINLGTGTTAVKIPSRTIWVGANRVYFGGSVFEPGSPIQNDWWFDHTNEKISVRASTGWHTVAAV